MGVCFFHAYCQSNSSIGVVADAVVFVQSVHGDWGIFVI